MVRSQHPRIRASRCWPGQHQVWSAPVYVRSSLRSRRAIGGSCSTATARASAIATGDVGKARSVFGRRGGYASLRVRTVRSRLGEKADAVRAFPKSRGHSRQKNAQSQGLRPAIISHRMMVGIDPGEWNLVLHRNSRTVVSKACAREAGGRRGEPRRPLVKAGGFISSARSPSSATSSSRRALRELMLAVRGVRLLDQALQQLHFLGEGTVALHSLRDPAT